MKKQCFVNVILISAVLMFVIFILLWKKEDSENRRNYYTKIEEESTEEEEKTSDKNSEELADADRYITDTNSNFLEEKNVEKKTELMDYAELPIEEFIKETGIPLCQEQDAQCSWRAEDELIIVSADVENDRLVNLCICVRTYGQSEEAITDAVERFPYILGGVSLHEDISGLEKAVLKNASMVSGEGPGYYYYTGMDLSRLGIERLTLESAGTTADTVIADIDISLKKETEGLIYIWGERVCQKEGKQNDQLTVSRNPYTELQGYYEQQENIDKTVVWIKYPCIDIPDNPEMAQSVNNLILETVERIENETYGKTDGNVIVRADYMITYMTSKFVSITFRVDVMGNDAERTPWQYCNINMERGGTKAVLADMGITKEKVAEACDNSWYPVDTEGYLEVYDTNWNQYRITPIKYILYVKPLLEDEELSSVKEFIPIEIFRD